MQMLELEVTFSHSFEIHPSVMQNLSTIVFWVIDSHKINCEQTIDLYLNMENVYNLLDWSTPFHLLSCVFNLALGCNGKEFIYVKDLKILSWVIVMIFFYVFLTMHHSIGLFLQPTLMHNSLTHVCRITILDMFRALTCPSSGGTTAQTQHLVSLLS